MSWDENMTISLIVFQLLGSSILGGLAVIGILFPKIKKRVSELASEFNKDETTEEDTKEISFKRSIIYCIISCLFTLIVGIVFVFIYGYTNVIFTLKRVLIVSVLFVAAYYDNLEYRIPNKLILYGIGCRLLLLLFEFVFYRDTVKDNLISEGIAVAALVILSVIGLLIVRNGIGMGDIKLFVLMGFCQGAEGVLSSVFATLICAFFYSVFLILTKKKSRKDFIAFAPCILIGTFLSVIIFGS